MNNEAWQAESTRLFQVRLQYLKLLKQVKEAKEEGIRCKSRTGKEGMERYHLIDRDKRILTGEHGTREEAWVEFLGEKK